MFLLRTEENTCLTSLPDYCLLIDRWVWSEGAAQPKLEEGLGIGGFGYPVSSSSFLCL